MFLLNIPVQTSLDVTDTSSNNDLKNVNTLGLISYSLPRLNPLKMLGNCKTLPSLHDFINNPLLTLPAMLRILSGSHSPAIPIYALILPPEFANMCVGTILHL